MVLIRGEANGPSIELSEREGLKQPAGSEFYRVTLRENEFEVSARVYAFDPTDSGIAKFFAELAHEWRGWNGTRTWSSLEGEFTLKCEHDRVGHITTTAALHSNSVRHGWIGEIRFDIAAGELENIAFDVAKFFVEQAGGASR